MMRTNFIPIFRYRVLYVGFISILAFQSRGNGFLIVFQGLPITTCPNSADGPTIYTLGWQQLALYTGIKIDSVYPILPSLMELTSHPILPSLTPLTPHPILPSLTLLSSETSGVTRKIAYKFGHFLNTDVR